jgi:hypothetical protein
MKPLAIVAILLIGGVKPKMVPALSVGIAWAVALPFAVADPDYVVSLYLDLWNMLTAMVHTDRHFIPADFTAVISSLGGTLDPDLVNLMRCLAAIATWGLAMWLIRRLQPNTAGLIVMILAASYMCLFNPRAEGLSYALPALPCAIIISAGLCQDRERTLWIACAAILFFNGVNGITYTALKATQFWFKPIFFSILLALMIIAIARTWTREAFASLLDALRPAPGFVDTRRS